MGLMIVLSLVLACVGTPPNSGDRWRNDYERSLPLKDKSKYDKALAYLDAALAQRPADRRMAGNAGGLFMDYFPHRERGIIYFNQGRLEEAEQELILSIDQSPTAKARFYLDRVRKKHIEREGLGTEPPFLVMEEPTTYVRTREGRVRIKGRVHDPAYVSAVIIDREPVFQEQAQQDMTFDRELCLSQGHHKITVAVTNLAGATRTRIIEILVDRQGPLVSLERPEANGDSLLIRGTVMDPSGIESFSIEGVPVSFNPGTRVEFSHSLPRNLPQWTLELRDHLDNMTRMTVDSDQCPAVSPSRAHAPQFDGTAPLIELVGWSDHDVVFDEWVYVDGMAHDAGDIKALTLNGENLLPASGALAAFNCFVDLKPGKNRLLVEATDQWGNKGTQELVIERRNPSDLNLTNPPVVMVFPFEFPGKIAFPEGTLEDHLISELGHDNRFRVVERDDVIRILDELNISPGGLADPENRVRIGKQASAQILLGGHMVQSRDGMETVCRVVDTETSESLATMDVFSNRAGMDQIQDLARGLSAKLHREFSLDR